MVLGFKENFPWSTEKHPAPSYFKEKVLAGVPPKYVLGANDYYRIDKIIELMTAKHFYEGMILRSLYNEKLNLLTDCGVDEGTCCKCIVTKIKPKLHTFRADPHDRWKAGRKIEMVYRGAGYKIKDHFNKDIPELGVCVSTQKIKIRWIEFSATTPTFSGKFVGPEIYVDEKRIENIEQLMANDGFDSPEQFFRWFNKDWEGKIIHWSSLRY